ncbi:unnamed protein product [Gadus morhua 'NCC']
MLGSPVMFRAPGHVCTTLRAKRDSGGHHARSAPPPSRSAPPPSRSAPPPPRSAPPPPRRAPSRPAAAVQLFCRQCQDPYCTRRTAPHRPWPGSRSRLAAEPPQTRRSQGPVRYPECIGARVPHRRGLGLVEQASVEPLQGRTLQDR